MSNVASVGRPSKVSKVAAGRRLATLIVSAVGGVQKVAGNQDAVAALMIVQINYGYDVTALVNPTLAAALAQDAQEIASAEAERAAKRAETIASGGTPPGRPAGSGNANQATAPVASTPAPATATPTKGNKS